MGELARCRDWTDDIGAECQICPANLPPAPDLPAEGLVELSQGQAAEGTRFTGDRSTGLLAEEGCSHSLSPRLRLG